MKTRNKLFTILAISAGAATATAFINKCIKISAISKNLLSEPESLTYNWRFGNINYTKSGTGKPLLLIHDLEAAANAREWDDLIPLLIKDYTVYTLDLLGCGLSEKPNLTYTNYLYVQLISDFIKSVIGHRTNIITSFASSSFAIMACNNAPDLFDRLMLINPESFLTCNQIPGKHAKLYKLILDFPVIGTLLYHICVSKKALHKDLEQDFFDTSAITSHMIDSCYESAHLGKSPKSLYASVKCNYTKCTIINAIKKINNSIYVIGGVNIDGCIPILEEYKNHNPAIETSTIRNSKKYPQIENPAELSSVIQMFFA